MDRRMHLVGTAAPELLNWPSLSAASATPEPLRWPSIATASNELRRPRHLRAVPSSHRPTAFGHRRR